MRKVPNGVVRCPKCGCSNTLRLKFYVDQSSFERIAGSCSRCNHTRTYLPLDYEGSSDA